VEERRILWLSFDSALAAEVALQGLTTTATRPVAVELLNPLAVSALRGDAAIVDPPAGHALCIAFEGTRTQCEWQMAALIAEVARVNPRELRELSDTSSESLWKGLVEFQAAGDDPATFSASLPPSKVAAFVDEATNSEIATQAHAGNGIVVGHLPDRCVSPSSVNEIVRPLRARAEAEGGSLVLWNCEDAWKAECSVFGASRPNVRWMQQVKLAMDPHNLMSPGRLPLSS
jgi:glycolate oxidase FAD binding subunit